MKNTERKRFEMLVRVSEFGNAHPQLFPPQSAAGQALATIDASIAEVGRQAVVTVNKKGSQAVSRARKALLAGLDAVGRCALLIAEDTPDFDVPFRMPVSEADQELVAAGRSFAVEAAARRSQFEAYMPADQFLSLGRLADDFDEERRVSRESRKGTTAARAAIETAMSSGMTALRKLDFIVPNLLGGDEVALAVWDEARKVEYFRRRRAAAPSPAPSPGGVEEKAS